MANVVSILNMKGGVGKTTICLNLACVLAEKGKKVLVIDFDPQANVSEGFLTPEEYKDHRKSKKQFITSIFGDLELIVSPVTKKKSSAVTLEAMLRRVKAYPSGGLIDLVPSELELATHLERAAGPNLEDRLKIILRGKKDAYDYVLVDCAPTLSLLTNNALRASDYVLIPVKPDPFSSRGIPLLLRKIKAHNAANTDEDRVKVLGIVLSIVNDKAKYVTSVKAELLREHKDIFKTEIHQHQFYARAIFENKSIFETRAAQEFKDEFTDFADEFLARIAGGGAK